MADKLTNLKARRGRAWEAANALMDTVSSLNRAMTATENEQYENHMSEIADCDKQAERIENLSKLAVDKFQATGVVNHEEDTEEETSAHEKAYKSKAYRKAFRQALLGRLDAMTKVYQDFNIGTPASGGYAVPTDWFKGLVQKRYQNNIMRQVANVITADNDINITVENGMGSATWVAEKANAHNYDDSDSDTLARVTISAYKLSFMDKVSQEMLADSSPVLNVEAWITERTGTKFGRAEEQAYLVGVGSTQPTGMLSGINHGWTFASEFGPTADEIFGMFHSLGVAYRDQASWIFHDQTVLLLRKLNTGSTFKQYLWQPGLTAGAPDTLLGKPVYTSAFMPQFGTPANKVAAFGSFKDAYWIVDRQRPVFQRLNELYAQTGQIGILCSERTDGKTVLSEAAVYASCGTGS